MKMRLGLRFFVLWGYRQRRENAHPSWWAKWFLCGQLPIGRPRQAELAPKGVCYILAGIVSLRHLGRVRTPWVPPVCYQRFAASLMWPLQAYSGKVLALSNLASCLITSRKMRFPCLSHSHFCCCRNKDFTAFAVFKVSQGICYVNTHRCNGLRAVPLLISIERMNARVCLTSFWHAKDLANDRIMVAATVFLLWSISWTNTFFRWSSSIWYLHDQIQREFNYWLVKKLSSKDCLVLTCAEQSSYCFNRCLLGFNLFIETSDKSLCLGHVGIW